MSKLGKSNSLSHHFRKTITSSLVHSLGSGGRPAGSCAFVSPRGDGGGGAQGKGYLHSNSVGLNGNGNRSILGPEGSCRLTTFILTICKKQKYHVSLLLCATGLFLIIEMYVNLVNYSFIHCEPKVS